MTLDDLIYQFRVLVGDEAQPYLWSDDLLDTYADLAEAEACSRKALLTSSSIADLCIIPIVAGASVYARSTNTRQVYWARLANSSTNLQLTDATELNYIEPNWKSLSGDPKYLIIEDGSYELVPPPAEDTVLNLRVSHTPLTKPSVTRTFTIDEAHHYMLLFYMSFLAYSKRDADTENPSKALEGEAIFASYFGTRPDAYATKSVRQVRETNRPNGWL